MPGTQAFMRHVTETLGRIEAIGTAARAILIVQNS